MYYLVRSSLNGEQQQKNSLECHRDRRILFSIGTLYYNIQQQ